MMRDTEHLDGSCGMHPHDNEIWQQTPRHWKPEYQTQYNIERWMIWGQKPWRNPRLKEIRFL
jgi:hypothetical protein